MKIGFLHLVVIVGCTAMPARAAVPEAVARSSSPAGSAADASDAGSRGPDVQTGRALADLTPLGPPTGAKDELAVRPAAPASAVPEPATLTVFGIGLLLLFRRRSAT